MGVTREQVQERVERLKDFVKTNHLSFTKLEGLRNNSTGFYIEQEEQVVRVIISSQGGIRVIGKPGKLRSLLAIWGKKENTRYTETDESSDRREMTEPFSAKKQVMNSEGKTWKFNRGSWSTTEDTIYSQRDKDENLSEEEVYRNAGYEPLSLIELGEGGSSFQTEVYIAIQSKDPPIAKTPYVAVISLTTETQVIYITDFPSLIMLLSQLSSITEAISN